MKTRQGFVSNSSSSSFILIGKNIHISNINHKTIREKEIIALGRDLSEGQDVFKVKSVEQLAFLKAIDKLGDDSFIFVDSCAFGHNDDYTGDIQLKNIPTDGRLQYWTGEKDYSSSNDVNDLMYRYDEYGDANNEMQKYLRSKKINKIEKNN